MPDDRRFFMTTSARNREVRVYAPGSAMVRTAKAAVVDTDAKLSFDADQATDLVDALAGATGYYPCRPDLDAQRTQIRLLAEELRSARGQADTEADGGELAVLAMSRHVGHHLADAAYLVHQVYDAAEDRTVQEMLSELGLLIEAIQFGGTLSNPKERAAGHFARIQELRRRLPHPGGPT